MSEPRQQPGQRPELEQNSQQTQQQKQLRPQPESRTGLSLIPQWAWGATVALIILAAYTTWRSQRIHNQFADLEQRSTEEQQLSQALQSEQQSYQQILNIVAAKSTKRVQFKPTQGTAQSVASPSTEKNANGGAIKNTPAVTAYINPQMGLVLSADKMPETPSGHTLQLWITPQTGAPVRVAIFRPDANGQILLAIPPTPAMASAKSLAITDEPAGAPQQPTATPAWTAALP